MSNRATTNQIVAIGVEVVLFSVLSYFGIKWLSSALDPTSKQKQAAKLQAQKVIKSLGLSNIKELTDYELSIAALLVDPLNLSLTWKDIGGLDTVIEEIKESVILPFRKRSLYQSSSLLSPPKGVLLYGPPGCGKTMIAKATAKEAGCRFINLEVSSLTDKWYGESQKLASAVFSLARKIEPCIIFIDEIDSFLRSRESHDNEATAMMKAQFMSLWDGLLSESRSDIIVMAATNRPQDIDHAILRRLPCRFFVGLPQEEQRCAILNVILSKESLSEDVDISEIACLTNGYSGSDLKELCRLAALQCLREQLNDNDLDEQDSEEAMLNDMEQRDFINAVNRMKKNNLIVTKNMFLQQM